MTGQTSADLCQGLNKSKAAVSTKVSLQLYAKTWMQVLQCASLTQHPDTLLRRQKIKPKQTNRSEIEGNYYTWLTRPLAARWKSRMQ